MHHLAAFASTLLAQAGYQQVNALADALLPRQNNEYQMFTPWRIAGAYAGAAANVRTRFVTPSITLQGDAHVIPISGTLLAPTDPNYMDMTASPLLLKEGENLHVDMESNSATLAFVGVTLIRPGHKFEVKNRDRLRWVRGTCAITTVAGAWAGPGTIALENVLDGGMYTVYGMQAFFATALAARLIFPNQVERPGCIGQATAVLRSAPIFHGGLGAWGKFDSLALPQLEVLDTAAAAVTYTVWLLIGKE